jgi:lipopolysaccharide export LptBFGC system permease protein LptF
MRTNVTAYEVLVNQLLIFPSTLLKVFPTSCLIASLLTTNNLIKTNQLVAIYSTGLSPFDIIKKIFHFSIFVCLIQFCIGGFVKPYSLRLKNKIIPNLDSKFRNLEADGLMSSKITNGKMWIKKDNQFLKYQNYKSSKKLLENATIYSLNENGVIKRYLKTKKLGFNENWFGKNIVRLQQLDDRTPPLMERKRNQKVVLKTSIGNLQKFEQDITTLNIKKLIDYTTNLESSGLSGTKYKIIYLTIISSAINCILFTILGLGSLFTPSKRSSSTGLIAGLSFVFIIVFWLVEGYLAELGKSLKISPYYSAFGLQFCLAFLILTKFLRSKKTTLAS